MPVMAGPGTLGRSAGNMSVCNASYGMAQHPCMPGKYMDVALHNHSGPGTPASQSIPKGLRLGDEIELLPPERKQARNNGGADGPTNPQALDDGGPHPIRSTTGCEIGREPCRGRVSQYV